MNHDSPHPPELGHKRLSPCKNRKAAKELPVAVSVLAGNWRVLSPGIRYYRLGPLRIGSKKGQLQLRSKWEV